MNEELKKLQANANGLDAHALLESAARLIERALLQLDVRETKCDGCGRAKHPNLNNWTAYVSLTDVPSKLRTVSAKLVLGNGK